MDILHIYSRDPCIAVHAPFFILLSVWDWGGKGPAPDHHWEAVLPHPPLSAHSVLPLLGSFTVASFFPLQPWSLTAPHCSVRLFSRYYGLEDPASLLCYLIPNLGFFPCPVGIEWVRGKDTYAHTRTSTHTCIVSTRVRTDIHDHLRHCFLEFVDQTFFTFHRVNVTSILNSRDRVNDFKTLK